MAKDTKPQKKVGGPFLASAVFCNSVTEDADGVLSALRIVDEIRGLIAHNAPPDFPSKDKPVDVQLFALIIIRRGDSTAKKHRLRLVMEQPNGKTTEVLKTNFEFPDHQNGTANVRCKVSMKLFTNGTYWFDVMLGKHRLTRMALNLALQRAEESGSVTKPSIASDER